MTGVYVTLSRSTSAVTSAQTSRRSVVVAQVPARRKEKGLAEAVTVARRLNERENWDPGQVDREYASLIRDIACVDPATVRLSAPSAEGETKTYAGSIGAALLERAEELFDIPTRETAALVLNLDVHALGAGADPERDGGPRPGELEGVLQKVSHDRREDLSVSLDRHSFFNGHHRQSDATGVRLQYRGRCDFVDESRNEELLSILNGVRETDFSE